MIIVGIIFTIARGVYKGQLADRYLNTKAPIRYNGALKVHSTKSATRKKVNIG
jgi:hypothetical protein